MREVSAVVADDEPLARRRLRQLAPPWLEWLGEATDGEEAVRAVDELRPDVLFLDIEMPRLNGLEVLERIRHKPVVIFTTAHDRYAVTAFELRALDYLLKPFGRARFETTLLRIQEHLERTPGPHAVERARHALAPEPLRRLFARARDRIVPIPVDSIRRIQAQGDYAEVHSAAVSSTRRRTAWRARFSASRKRSGPNGFSR